jgi:hypothetical protein
LRGKELLFVTGILQNNQFLIDYTFWPVLFDGGQGTLGTPICSHAGFMHLAGNMLFCGYSATAWKKWARLPFSHLHPWICGGLSTIPKHCTR